MLDGQAIARGTVSTTVTEKLQAALLPDASVAVQCTVVVPLVKVDPLAGIQLDVTPGQLSCAVTVQLARPVFVTTIFAGQTIVGAWLSTTITRCVQLLALPHPSVAVQTTGFVPTGNCEGALLVTLTLPQLSKAVGLPSDTLLA